MEKNKYKLVVCTNSAGDRKLYAILVNIGGLVWNCEKERYEFFEKENLKECAIPLKYNGCDVYVLDLSHPYNEKLVLIYIQDGQGPSIYDQIYNPKEIPKKIKPTPPYMGTR